MLLFPRSQLSQLAAQGPPGSHWGQALVPLVIFCSVPLHQMPQPKTYSRITCKTLAGLGEPCGSQGTPWLDRNSSKQNFP